MRVVEELGLVEPVHRLGPDASLELRHPEIAPAVWQPPCGGRIHDRCGAIAKIEVYRKRAAVLSKSMR